MAFKDLPLPLNKKISTTFSLSVIVFLSLLLSLLYLDRISKINDIYEREPVMIEILDL